MKVTLEIHLEGNLVLPVTGIVESLGDVARLGAKLAAMPAGAKRLMPIVADLAVERLEVKTAPGGHDLPALRARRGKSTKRARASEQTAAAASA